MKIPNICLQPIVRARVVAVAYALQNGGWMNETPLTTHLGGTSGTGAAFFRKQIQGMHHLGLLTQETRGRARYYQAKPGLVDWARTQTDDWTSAAYCPTNFPEDYPLA